MNELSVNDAFDEIEMESFDFIWEEWEEYKGDIPMWQHIFCGSIAGLMEHVFMYPLDTLKTYIQTNDRLKSKKMSEMCNLYSCTGNNNHFSELCVHNNGISNNININAHIDKKKFCSSTGCDNCIYNKTCCYNICNMKIFGRFNKNNMRSMNTFQGLGGNKNLLSKFHYNLRAGEKDVAHVKNKQFRQNNYCNKILNKRLNSKCNDKYANCNYRHMSYALKGGRRYNLIVRSSLKSDDSPSAYNCKNRRVNSLMHNINKMEYNKLRRGSDKRKENLGNGNTNIAVKNAVVGSSSNGSSNNKDNNCNRNNCNLKEKKVWLFLDNKKENNFRKWKEVLSKSIYKKDKVKESSRRINYYKYSMKSKSMKILKRIPNFSIHLKLLLQKEDTNYLKHGYLTRMQKNKILLNSILHKNILIKNEKGNNTFLYIKRGNCLSSLVNSMKETLICSVKKCYHFSRFNKIIKVKDFSSNLSFKFFFQKFMCAGDANVQREMLRNYFKLPKGSDNNNNSKNSNGSNSITYNNSYGNSRSRYWNYYNFSRTNKKGNTFQNCYMNILNTLKNKKNYINTFAYSVQKMKSALLTNFRLEKNTSSLILSNEERMRNKCANYSTLFRNNNIFLNNLMYVTKSNNCKSLFDRNIHSSNKPNFYKNCSRNRISNEFNKNFKSFNFFKSIFPDINNRINITTRYNCSLIRNNVVNLYKGVNVVMLGCIPAHALYFSTFEYSKKYFSSMSTGYFPVNILNSNSNNRSSRSNKIDGINYKLNDLNYFGIAVSGFLATVAHDIIITPIDTLKQRIQLGINKNSLDSLKILRENGIRSLYLSLPITLLMNIPYQIIMICTNEKMKKIYFEYVCNMNGASKNNYENKYTSHKDSNSGKVKEEFNDLHNSQNKRQNINIINEYNELKRTEKCGNNTSNSNCNMEKVSGMNNKLMKFYIDQDLYSMNNFSKNRERKFLQNDIENAIGRNLTGFNEEQTNRDLFIKNVVNRLENDSSNNNGTQHFDHKIRDSFDISKQKFNNNMELKNIWMDNYNKNDFFNKTFNHITSYFVCAGIGGGIAAVVTNPLDVIKTRIQTECFNTKGFNFFRVVSNLYYKEGLRSFFKGSLARMALCIPASAVSWGTYETMKRFFKINFNSM
ncbi:mitochondrial carrier protein, putative [Plasmodium malariae]|uniref:Mitochondrial carrier protein, putative n=1 Tax=Plasmodium malariae TaxID=5858 RepID=A0A1D3JMC8_PLAMA|nr:mitochondrial carrier protein, putative [Plasmodium malariae]SBT87706.1 mitochondrial carrier protein, putative [Plasmodium malariae]